ncbi:DUF6134 family protein [Magnetovibrio blakemorei]|nr:DUF6134 family protein [Magnetovibrio blakemorei]
MKTMNLFGARARTYAFTSAVFAFATIASWQAHAVTKTLDFTVLRDGKTIGTHSYTISDQGDETLVEVSTDIQVKVLFITAYKFHHTSKELWRGGKLVSLTSTTNDDGTQKALQVTASPGKLDVDSIVHDQDRRQSADINTQPASLWNPTIVHQHKILNTLDGTMMKINVSDFGTEVVEAAGAQVSAHHYAISGELTRDVWFNDAGDLVRVRFPDKTNSEIIYALK